ncbi:hypothetical protein OROGR_031698 [Orobanche gracilis]
MMPKIYLFGDSITEMSFADGGWGASLTSHFARKADVVLRGYSGYNTRWALKVIDRVFPAAVGDEPPLAVTVFFGANDASLPDRNSAFQHVPLDEYKRNLLAIVAFFKKKWPSTRIILITPPPIDEEARLRNPYAENPMGLPERTNEAASQYAKTCVEVADECGLPAINLCEMMQQFPDWRKAHLSDGLHLAEKGNKLVFTELIKVLAEEQISAETLPADLPLYYQIDPNDPLRVFEEK